MSTPPAERRPRLDAATDAIRHAARAGLAGLGEARPAVVAAVSGGADSLALAAALAFLSAREAEDVRPRVSAAVVDHGLQDGSAEVAVSVAGRLRNLGLDARVLRAPEVPDAGQGLEARAREARYAALESFRVERGASAILTGHTLDDQAETVLLGLARGAGARSLAGMPARRGAILRPLLGITREHTRASCIAQNLEVWDDPMNDDRAFARVRARHEVLPVLERELGPGIAAALARTAGQLAADADALEAWAARVDEELPTTASEEAGEFGRAPSPDPAPQGAGLRPEELAYSGDALSLAVLVPAALAAQPQAIRTRVIRCRLARAGGEDPTYRHVTEVDALLCGRRASQVSLPGALSARAHPKGVVLMPSAGLAATTPE